MNKQFFRIALLAIIALGSVSASAETSGSPAPAPQICGNEGYITSCNPQPVPTKPNPKLKADDEAATTAKAPAVDHKPCYREMAYDYSNTGSTHYIQPAGDIVCTCVGGYSCHAGSQAGCHICCLGPDAGGSKS